MSKLTKSDQAEVAHNYYQQLQDLIRQQGMLFLDIGRLLKILRDERLYGDLGYDTWSSFIASGEIGVKHSTVYAYIGIYEMFVLRYKFKYDDLAGIPWDKLWLALPAVRKLDTREDVVEVVEQARSLPRTDLIVALGGEKVENNVRSKVVKVFKHDDCGKWAIDLPANELCQCK